MLSDDKLFGNLFDDEKITSTRLANFAEDCLNRFKGIAIEGEYATTIAELTLALDHLRDDLGDVDTGLNNQKVKTTSVNQFINRFKDTMRTAEGMVIFQTAGGRTSAVYQELYPNGVTEYSKVNKTKMATLMNRVNEVANKYGTDLNSDLVTMLGQMKTGWQTLRSQQEQQMSKVSDKRNDRSETRQKMELALHNAYHTVALKFPFDVSRCKQFFNFTLLYGVKHQTQSGDEGQTEGQVAEQSEDQNTVQPEQEVAVAE